MQEFSKCNKIPGVYWLKHSLDDMLIRIKLKFKDDIISLPTFEDFQSKSHEESLHVLDNNKIEVHEFKWQEKVFSAWELQKYSDTYNCDTETERIYNETITKSYCEAKKVFTYINEDYHLPVPVAKIENMPSNLTLCLAKLNFGEKFGISKDLSSSKGHLYRSEQDISSHDQWMSMHIVLDSSEYNEDSQLLYKQENILLSIYHNITQNYMMISPDVNDIEFNPYIIEDSGSMLSTTKLQEYGVEIEMNGRENTEELVELLTNLHKKWEKKQKNQCSFVMPPLGKRKYFLNFEIVSAMDFEMDNIYIEYEIKISDDIKCNGDTKGRTHISKKMYVEDEIQWKYGHMIELDLECSTGIDPPPLKIYFQAISTDHWLRHNTQGYSYLSLTPEPGYHDVCLSCSRPEEMDDWIAESRRFFVGGCHLLKDLDVLSNPDLQDANFKYVSTGRILVRWQILSQAHTPASLPQEPHTATDLLRGAEAVLRQYKKAKATLEAASGITNVDIVN